MVFDMNLNVNPSRNGFNVDHGSRRSKVTSTLVDDEKLQNVFGVLHGFNFTFFFVYVLLVCVKN